MNAMAALKDMMSFAYAKAERGSAAETRSVGLLARLSAEQIERLRASEHIPEADGCPEHS